MGIRIDQLNELITLDGTEYKVVADNNDLDEKGNPKDKKVLGANEYLNPTNVKTAYESNANTNAFTDNFTAQLEYNFRESPREFQYNEDSRLNSPDGSVDTTNNNLVVISSLGGTYVHVGTSYWLSSAVVGTQSTFTGENAGTIGSIYFSTHAGLWNSFYSYNGVVTFVFGASQGYFAFGYYEDAWKIAFDGNNSDVVIATNGDVYKESIAPENLVNTYDGVIGPAGAAPVSTIEDYVVSFPAGSFDLYDNPADYEMKEGVNSNTWFHAIGTGDYLYAKVELPSDVKEGSSIKYDLTGFAKAFVSATDSNVSLKIQFAWSEYDADSWDVAYGTLQGLGAGIGTAQDMITKSSYISSETIPVDKRFGLIRITRTTASTHALIGDYCITGLKLYFETE